MPEPLTARERSLANLIPITSETARELGKRSGESKRRKKQEREEHAKTLLAKLAYERLFKILEDDKAYGSTLLGAVNTALDRSEGKVAQPVEAQEGKPVEELTAAEIQARLREIRAA